jgi:hypothetical protein
MQQTKFSALLCGLPFFRQSGLNGTRRGARVHLDTVLETTSSAPSDGGGCVASLKAALKTRAVQTLRAARGRPVVAKRLDCARFIAALGMRAWNMGHKNSVKMHPPAPMPPSFRLPAVNRW